MLKQFPHPPRLEAAPQRIHRTAEGIHLTAKDGTEEQFDQVVIGAHADEALQLLADPSDEEKANLGAWRYQPNEVTLHTSTDHLPPEPKQWASWNFIREGGDARDRPVRISYYMNRLQRLEAEQNYVVTLNAGSSIPEESIINRTTLTHPLYSKTSIASQPRLRAMNGQRHTWFCGSYFGYGFHEDAVQSAVEVARGFGIEL
jgi:predicted NAD/FAD-binding protein